MGMTMVHLICMVLTIAFVLGAGIYAARSVHSAEGYSLGGRAAGVPLIMGSIAGTCVGGGATIGTAQLAYTMGLSGWWYTLGTGIALILMGLFYAGPLRKTALTTIPEFLSLHYGPRAGRMASIVSSLGIWFSVVASTLPGIQLIKELFGLPAPLAAVVLLLLVLGYVFFGGMKSAGIGGILKMAVIWFSLFLAGGTALYTLFIAPETRSVLPDFPWYSLLGGGTGTAVSNALSMIVGIICTQSYIQAIFSAANPRTAAAGAFMAALIVLPVGLPCAAMGMYMQTLYPDINPILAMPLYLFNVPPAFLGGIAMGGIVLSLVSSIGGLSLGIGTMVSHDLLAPRLKLQDDAKLLRLNRLAVLGVLVSAAIMAMANEGTQVLFWTYLSMALRGAGIFLPLSLAVFLPGRFQRGWITASIYASTFVSLAAIVCQSPVKPLFLGVGCSVLFVLIAYWQRQKEDPQIVYNH